MPPIRIFDTTCCSWPFLLSTFSSTPCQTVSFITSETVTKKKETGFHSVPNISSEAMNKDLQTSVWDLFLAQIWVFRQTIHQTDGHNGSFFFFFRKARQGPQKFSFHRPFLRKVLDTESPIKVVLYPIPNSGGGGEGLWFPMPPNSSGIPPECPAISLNSGTIYQEMTSYSMG